VGPRAALDGCKIRSQVHFTFTIAECLNHRNKEKEHNRNFVNFLKYINKNMGYMFRLAPSHLQALNM